MKKEKKFEMPEIEIVAFLNDDIILTSGEGDYDEENIGDVL